MSTGIGELTTATVLLAEEIKKREKDLSASLNKLELALDEFQDFFKTSNIDAPTTLDEITAQLVETYKTLKLLTRIEATFMACDSNSWTAFKIGLEGLTRDQFSPVFDSIIKYTTNIKDIAAKKQPLTVKEIGEKNELFTDNRKEIREAIEDLYDVYFQLIKGIKWHSAPKTPQSK